MIFPKSSENDVLGVASKRIQKRQTKEEKKTNKLIDFRNQIDTLRSRDKQDACDKPVSEATDTTLHEDQAKPQNDGQHETDFYDPQANASHHERVVSEPLHADHSVNACEQQKENVQVQQVASEELLVQLRSEIDFLRQQLDRKDRQLEVKDDLLENFQVLLKNEQDKVMLLENNRKPYTWWQRLTGRITE